MHPFLMCMGPCRLVFKTARNRTQAYMCMHLGSCRTNNSTACRIEMHAYALGVRFESMRMYCARGIYNNNAPTSSDYYKYYILIVYKYIYIYVMI
jgi:hypothetical protein